MQRLVIDTRIVDSIGAPGWIPASPANITECCKLTLLHFYPDGSAAPAERTTGRDQYRTAFRTILATAVFVSTLAVSVGHSRAEDFELEKGDHVVYIGNTMADRMQHHAWLETYIHALHKRHDLTFRNLGFPGDEVKTRSRSANFGDPDQWLTKCQADVVFCFFGYNEALRGEAGLAEFQQDLAEMIDHMGEQTYNGKSPPRLILFSPIATRGSTQPSSA